MRQLTREDYESLLEFRASLRRFLHWSQAKAREAGLTPAQHQLLLAIKGHRGTAAGRPSVTWRATCSCAITAPSS